MRPRTTLIEGQIKARVEQIKVESERSDSDYNWEKLEERRMPDMDDFDF